ELRDERAKRLDLARRAFAFAKLRLERGNLAQERIDLKLTLLDLPLELLAQIRLLLGRGRLEDQAVLRQSPRPTVPVERFEPVLRHAEPLLVRRAEVELRARVALLRGAPIPLDGRLVVRFAAEAALVDFADDGLRLRIAALRSLHPHVQRGAVVRAVVRE